MILQHNLIADNAARQYSIVVGRRGKSMERLSSGYKVNRASDDAANLTISEKMRYQIRGLGKASENAQDGISLLQIADGALEEDHAIIQRIRELSVKAANGTNTEADREAIQEEINQLITEVDRIADSTEFNTMKILDGSFASEESANAVTTAMRERSRNAEYRGDGMQNVNGAVVFDPIVVGGGVSASQAGELNDVLKNSMVPQAVNSFLNTFSVFNDAKANGQLSNEIGLKLYKDSSSTLAYVAIGYSYGSDGMIKPDSIKLNLSVNAGSLRFDAAGKLTQDSRTALETTIVHEMMHAFMDDVLINGMVGAKDGKVDKSQQFPKWFKEGMAQSASGGCANTNDWVNGSMGLNASSSESQISAVVKSSANKLTGRSISSQYGTGYLASMYLGYLAAGKPTTLTGTNLASGLNTVMQKLVDGDTLSDVIKDVSGGAYTSLSDFEKKFGDADSSKFISELLKTVGNTGSGGVVNASNSLTDSDLLPDTNATSPAYQLDLTREYVTSSVGNGRNWNSGGSGGSGDYSYPSERLGPMVFQIGLKPGQCLEASIEDAHALTLGLDYVNVMNAEDAAYSIEICDDALEKISSNRSQIGAYVNRLEHTIKNLDNVVENTQAAESRIRDTDIAKEMVEYAKTNILAQVGESMTAQANQSKQQVLGLLQ